MLRNALIVLILAIPFYGCTTDSEADQRGEIVKIVIASNPPGATILMKGAPIGKTPMQLSVRQATSVNLELQGYKKQQLLVDPTGPLNLVVNLVPLPITATPDKEKKPTSAQPEKTFTSLKQSYRSGEIDKVEYSRQVTKLKHKMRAELNSLKEAYRRGDIDKVEYRRRAQKIKHRYKG